MDNRAKAAKKQNEASELITSGHIGKAVWYLAWPTAVNTIIQTLYSVINRVFLGHSSNHVSATDQLAAVGAGGALLMIQFAIMFGLSVGTSALVARFLGAENYKDADEATRQSIILSILFGILTMIPLIIYARPLVILLGAHGKVISLAASYTAIIAYTSVPAFLYMTITSAMRSAGDVIRPLYVGAVLIAINILFDWLLITGVGPFPTLGVAGAAIATGISRIVAMVLIFFFLKSSALGDSMSNLKAHFGWFKRILRIGFPAMGQTLLWTTASAIYFKLLGGLPDATVAQAALTVSITIESFAFMPGSAYSAAATPMVGQNLGAGKPERAQHSAWVATAQAALIMSIISVLFLVIPAQLAHIFTKETAVVALIVWYLRLNAISEPIFAVGMTLRGALQGAGDVVVPTIITLISLWIVRLPLTWILIKLGYGAKGAWFAMSFTTGLSGILIAIWFRKGRWKSAKV